MKEERPISVTAVGILYMAVGAIGFGYHFGEMRPPNSFHWDAVWIELLRLLAIVCGVYLLRRNNWARWVALAWIAVHVIVSAFQSLPQFAVHCLFCAVIAWILFRPDASRYFQRTSA